MMTNSMGLKIASEIACIVYDPQTGDVLHVHVDTTLEGAAQPDEESVRADTLEHHKNLFNGKKRAAVETMFVDPAELEQRGVRRIDLKSRKLLVSPAPSPVSPSAGC
jgi:hypothetical protein